MVTVSRPRRLAILLGAVAIGAAAGIVASVALSSAPGRPAASPSPSASPSVHAGYAGGIQDPVAAPTAGPAGVPVSIEVPSIGASSTLETLRTDRSGKLIPPARPGDAGWYAAGIVPGQVGPALIAGHIDYAAGPGIFERLEQMRVGDEARVTMSTGAVLTFRMDSAREAPKAQFPTAAVYGTTPDPQLRLVTCAGIVDPSTHLYRDNYVVFLTLVR